MSKILNILNCDMKSDCECEVSYIDHKGFIYCETHGKQRQQYSKCRKLRKHEINRLKSGKQLKSY